MIITKNLPIYNYLDLSTAHIKEKTFEWLIEQIDNEESPIVVYRKESGLFVCVTPDITEEGKTPTDLWYCLWFAYEHGCNWILFDADGAVIDDLAQYEW